MLEAHIAKLTEENTSLQTQLVDVYQRLDQRLQRLENGEKLPTAIQKEQVAAKVMTCNLLSESLTHSYCHSPFLPHCKTQIR